LKTPDWLLGDPGILLGARAVRSFIFGYLQVVLAIYLDKVGFSPFEIGVLFALETFVTSLLMLAVSFMADQYGRKKVLLLAGVFMIAMGLLYASTTNFLALLVGAALAGIRGGPVQTAFAPVEQALLAGKVSARLRTTTFGVFAFVGSMAVIGGALLSGLPDFLRTTLEFSLIASYQPLFALVVAAGVLNIFLILRVRESPRPSGPRSIMPRKSSGRMVRLFISSGLDGFGAGFILPFFAYWFYLRFGAEPGSIGLAFAGGELLSAAGLLVGARMAYRVGLVKALVLTRVPVILLTAFLPFSPTFDFARAFFIFRFFFANMDLPLIQSYTMAITDEAERASVAGVVNMGKRLATVVGQGGTGFLFQQALLFPPFLIASSFYIASAGTFYFFFRKLRPPEELTKAEPLRHSGQQ